MFNLSKSKLDRDAIDNGAWVKIKPDPDQDPFEIKVIGMNSESAKAYRAKLERSADVMDKTRTGALTPDASERITRQTAVFCVKDWRGVAGDDGKPVKFQPDFIEMILQNPEQEHVSAAIYNAIGDVSTKMAAKEDAVLGNSEAS